MEVPFAWDIPYLKIKRHLTYKGNENGKNGSGAGGRKAGVSGGLEHRWEIPPVQIQVDVSLHGQVAFTG